MTPTRWLRTLVGGPWLFPVVVLALLVVATALAVNGSSSGALFKYLYGTDPDPRLLLGTPRAVRSDEWLVTTPVLLSQAAQGFPRINDALATGVDVSLVYDVPYADWSVLLRPQHWGFAVLPLDHAFTLRWWLPTAVLLLALYALSLQLLPGRRLLACALALGVVLAPYTQWWFSAAVPPLAWSAGSLAAFVWLLAATTRRQVVLRSAAFAYSLAALGVLVYPPYVVPCTLVVAAWGVGHLLLVTPSWPRRRLLPVLAGAGAAGTLAASLCLAFVLSRRDVVVALQDTDYPGDRTQPSGGFPAERLLYGHLTPNLQRPEANLPGPLEALGGNQSEASAFVLLGLLAVVLPVWLVVRAARHGLRVNPVLVALLGVAGLFLAHLLVPAASPLSRLLLLHLVTHERLHLGLGLVSTLLVLAAAWELERQGAHPQLLPAASWGLAVLVLLVTIGIRLQAQAPVAAGGLPVVVLCSVVVACLVALLVSGRVTAAAVGLAGFCAVAVVGVNPLYRGVFDVRDTPVGTAIAEAQRREPDGAWVSTGGLVHNALVVGAGVPTFSGAFAYPVPGAWDELDPEGSARAVYNRYAHLVFAEGQAGPALQNPQPDIVGIRFDACDAFAQRRIAHVLADRPSSDPCLRLRERLDLTAREVLVYEVVLPGR